MREHKSVVYADGQSSYSPACQEARARGRLPMTGAVREVRATLAAVGQRCTIAQARAALRAAHDGEWHHVSKYGNRVSYYSVMDAVELLRPEAARARERQAKLAQMRERLAQATLTGPLQRPHRPPLQRLAEFFADGRPPAMFPTDGELTSAAVLDRIHAYAASEAPNVGNDWAATTVRLELFGTLQAAWQSAQSFTHCRAWIAQYGAARYRVATDEVTRGFTSSRLNTLRARGL